MAAPELRLTPERYLDVERRAERRSEFVGGQVYAMAGGTPEHNQIAPNIAAELRQRLRSRGCRTFSSDQRVYSPSSDAYLYPDVTVVCGSPTFTDRFADTLANPTLIVEVLSPSTELFDRGIKFGLYRQIPSLRVYVLVSSREARVEVFCRQDDGDWRIEEFVGRDATLAIPEWELAIPLADIYDQIDLSD